MGSHQKQLEIMTPADTHTPILPMRPIDAQPQIFVTKFPRKVDCDYIRIFFVFTTIPGLGKVPPLLFITWSL